MTRPLWAGFASAWLAASASVMAANVWESKPFHTWTAKELEKVLTSSPWAGKGSITYVNSRPQPIQEESIVTWASARVIRGALAREEFGVTPEIPKGVEALIAQTPAFYIVTIKISNGPGSASHARQAAMMQNETFLQIRGKPPIPAVQAEGEVIGLDGKPLAAPEGPTGFRGGAGRASGPAVSGPPAQRGGGGGGTAGQQVGGGGQRGGGRGGFGGLVSGASSLVIFRFQRDPITLDDKEVEFVTKLCGGGGGLGPLPSLPGVLQLNPAGEVQRGGGRGFPGDVGGRGGSPAAQGPSCNYNVKKKFKLKDMVVNGELAL